MLAQSVLQDPPGRRILFLQIEQTRLTQQPIGRQRRGQRGEMRQLRIKRDRKRPVQRIANDDGLPAQRRQRIVGRVAQRPARAQRPHEQLRLERELQIGLEDVAECRGDAARDERPAPARRRRAQRPGGKTVDVQCDGPGREPEAVGRHRAAQVTGMPAEVQHGGVEPRADGQRTAGAVHVAVETQLREAAGREFQPSLAVGMRSAHIDIVAAQQAGALGLQGMIHQTPGVVIGRAIEARHLHHGFVHQQRWPLDAKERVRHPAVDIVGAVREQGQL